MNGKKKKSIKLGSRVIVEGKLIGEVTGTVPIVEPKQPRMFEVLILKQKGQRKDETNFYVEPELEAI